VAYNAGLVRMGMFVGMRKVPTHGVRWEGEPLPPDSVRRCKICQQPINHLSSNRVCCSHPRCQRINRSAPRKPRPKATGEIKKISVVREIMRRYEYAKSKGATDVQAYTVISARMKMTVAEVMATVKGEK
jgi:hypothetical protein